MEPSTLSTRLAAKSSLDEKFFSSVLPPNGVPGYHSASQPASVAGSAKLSSRHNQVDTR